MSDKRKQHYVPQMYLKNFADGKLFNVYNIEKNKLIPNIPFRTQCYENNFYGKDKKYEDELSKLETKWSINIKQILDNDGVYNDENASSLKEFCCFQYLRTKNAYFKTKRFYEKALKFMIPSFAQANNMQINDEFIQYISDKYMERNDIPTTMKFLVDIAKNYKDKLNDLQITVLKNKSDLNFITSDNPVIVGNEYQPKHGVGLDCIGFYMLVPLSTKFYIAIIDSKIYPKFRNKYKIIVSLDLVKQLNHMQFINSNLNIYGKTIDEITSEQSYIDNLIPVVKQNLIDKYNNKYNNFLTNEYKLKQNLAFKKILEKVDKTVFIYRSKLLRPQLNLFKICEPAKVYSNNIKYNFRRSASDYDRKLRVSRITVCDNKKILVIF